MKAMSLKLCFAIVCSAIMFTACSDDDSTPTDPTPTRDIPPGVYIIHEGGFGSNNASLSYYIPDSNKVYNDVYKNITGESLGDVGQDIVIHGDLVYLVVNNSNKIEVLNHSDWTHSHTIELPNAQPRYMYFARNDLGYITNSADGTVSVYDPASKTITATVPVGNNPEDMEYSQSHVFVANGGFGSGNTVSVINIGSNTVEATITVGDYPQAIEYLSTSKIAVLCTGAYGDFNDPNDDTPGYLYIINTQTYAVEDSMELGGHPTHMTADLGRNVYISDGTGIDKVNTTTMQWTQNFVNGTFYGLKYDSQRNRLYATDAKDFQQDGDLYVYSSAGSLLFKYTLGIAPRAMAIVE